MSNSKIAKDLFERVWNNRELELTKELFDEKFNIYNPAIPDFKSGGVAGFLATVKLILEAFPDMEFVIDDLIEQDDKIVVRWRGRGHHEGDFFGVAPTHKKVTYAGIAILQIAKDKIIKAWVMDNTLSML